MSELKALQLSAPRLKATRGLVSAALVAVVSLVVVPLTTAPAASGDPTAAGNPVISSVAPDPSVQRGADGAFHVYATSDDWGDGAGHRLIPHFRSFDLVEWEYVGDAFTSRPAWAPSGSFLWAPDVHVMPDGSAVMYYTTGGARPCIGRATAPGIEGAGSEGLWRHDSTAIVCFGADEPYQDLDPMDPEVVFTDDGPVMFMGNFEGIHAVTMNADGTALKGEPVLVAGTGVEAPAVVTRDGRTHLFTSAGLCCDGESSQYRVLGGRADDLVGPYETRDGVPLTDRLAGDVILQGNDSWVGPGHVAVATDDSGQDWMLYHAAPRGSAVLPNGVQRRYMMLDRLDWVAVPGAEGSWPVVGDGTPSSDRPADPVVTLPVRLTAVGGVTVRVNDDKNDDDEVLDLSVRVDSTGSAYSGELTATLTGPRKQRQALQFVDPGPHSLPGLPVSVSAGGSLEQALALQLDAPLAPGRYELVVAIGPAAGAPGQAGAAQELAVFGFEVPGDDLLGSLSSGSLSSGSLPLGSLPIGPASFGSGQFGS